MPQILFQQVISLRNTNENFTFIWNLACVSHLQHFSIPTCHISRVQEPHVVGGYCTNSTAWGPRSQTSTPIDTTGSEGSWPAGLSSQEYALTHTYPSNLRVMLSALDPKISTVKYIRVAYERGYMFLLGEKVGNRHQRKEDITIHSPSPFSIWLWPL